MTETETAAAPAPYGSRVPKGPWVEMSPRRVRAYLGGAVVADTTRALLVFEKGPVGAYWLPKEDFAEGTLVDDGASSAHTTFFTVKAGAKTVDRAARAYAEPPAELAALRGHVTLYWDRMDAWFEEDDEVFVEPRNPYHRVDVVHSSRHIRVEVNGQTVAETRRPRLLFETGLPTRYYIPKADVRMDLLEPTETSSSCPYKGIAVYWSVRAGGEVAKDVVWGYPRPIPECSKIENLVAFWNEKVTIFVDGEREVFPSR